MQSIYDIGIITESIVYMKKMKLRDLKLFSSSLSSVSDGTAVKSIIICNKAESKNAGFRSK